jgi:hypothetical protein
LPERLGASFDQAHDLSVKADGGDDQEQAPVGTPQVDPRRLAGQLRGDRPLQVERQIQLARPDVARPQRHHAQGHLAFEERRQHGGQQPVSPGAKDRFDAEGYSPLGGLGNPVQALARPELGRPARVTEGPEDAVDRGATAGARARVDQDDSAGHAPSAYPRLESKHGRRCSYDQPCPCAFAKVAVPRAEVTSILDDQTFNAIHRPCRHSHLRAAAMSRSVQRTNSDCGHGNLAVFEGRHGHGLLRVATPIRRLK